MTEEQDLIDQSPPPSAPDPEPNPNPNPNSVIHPRRVSFEHGLLPIQKLVFTDPIQTLAPVMQKFTDAASNNRVGSAAVADVLQISGDHARLVLETLGSVLHLESDPLVRAKPEEVDSVGADLRDLILFLYIQSYKKLLPRTRKDSAAVADVWPSTSAFDGYLSALSPIQLVRSNSRRFMPSQADDEAHQLSYLQKHLANIISLLAEPVEGDGEESLVLSMDAFEHLGFLVQFGDKGSDVSPLSQATPFFANSDPDMPTVPVPASQVHDWLLQNIASALESITERISGKENGPSSASDQDDAISDACAAPNKVVPSGRGSCLMEGVSKTSLVKQASDLKGRSVKVRCEQLPCVQSLTNTGKSRGFMRAGRKLKKLQINQRWADRQYKKCHQRNGWKKPFAGSSHAEIFVLEKTGMESKKRRSNAPLENESKRRKVEGKGEILRKLKMLEKSVESLKDEVKKVLTEDYRRPTPVNLEEPDMSYLDPLVIPHRIFVQNLHSNASVKNVKTFFKGFHIKVSSVEFKPCAKEGVKNCFVTLEPGKHKEAMALNGNFMRISRDSGSHVFMSITVTTSIFTVFVRIGSKSGNYNHGDMRSAIKTHFKNESCDVLNIFVPQKQSLIAYALLRAKEGMLAKFCALRKRMAPRIDEEGREDEGYKASVGRFEMFVRSADLKKKFFESDGLDVKSFLK